MPNYHNGKIYRLVCNKTGLQYIGSTTTPLSNRKSKHKQDYDAVGSGKRKNNITSFKIIENGDYNIILIENYPCESKEELLQRERYYIESMECVNKLRPIITEDERKEYQSKIQKIKHKEKYEYNKKYREKNFDHIASYMKDYVDQRYDELYTRIECECGGHYCKQSKSKHLKTKKHQEYINNKKIMAII